MLHFKQIPQAFHNADQGVPRIVGIAPNRTQAGDIPAPFSMFSYPDLSIVMDLTGAPQAGLPVGLRAVPGFLPVMIERPADNLRQFDVGLANSMSDFRDALVRFDGLREIRILLRTHRRARNAEVSQEQARLIAKLAQTARDCSADLCVTPPHLRSSAVGELKMALSLLIQEARLPGLQTDLSLAARMAPVHGLVLERSDVGPPESFPIRIRF